MSYENDGGKGSYRKGPEISVVATTAYQYCFVVREVRDQEDYQGVKNTFWDPKEIVGPVENCALLPHIVELG